jgi:N-acetylglucosamine kinase-like BadF-type ATPase
MKNYVIGMDGGGTKTAVVVSDRSNHILLEFEGGAINYNGGNKAIIDSNLQNIVQTILEKGFEIENCAAICIGAAGVSNPVVREQILAIIRKCGYQGPVKIVGDDETAFAGALDKPYGMILIAGTGSICYGKDAKGNTYRTGGYGHLIDDVGSGYAVARDILSCVVQAHDGRIEPTILTQLVYEYLKINSIAELITFVYQPGRNKKEIAALSVLIEKACDQKDQSAMKIVRKCAEELVTLVVPIIPKLGDDICLAVTGSLLLKNEEIYTEFIRSMNSRYPEVVVSKPKQNAAFGATVLALGMLQR